jgi:hypothetical protein
MKGSVPFAITEWDWFMMELRMYSLETHSKGSARFFYVNDDDKRLYCQIHEIHVEAMRTEKANKKEQLRYYREWVLFTKRDIKKILQRLPNLKRRFDVNRDMVFNIQENYGMGCINVCEFIGKKARWGRKTLRFKRADAQRRKEMRNT